MYTKILFLILLFALCKGTPIEYESKSDDDNAHYEFEYSVHDEHTGDIKDQHESRKGDVVEGEYSLVEPDGQKRIVKYSSNKHDGFQAYVERGETKHPVAVAHHVAPIEVAHHIAPVAIAHHVTPVLTHHVAYAQPVEHIAHFAHVTPVAHVAHVAHVAPVAHIVPVVHKHVATSTSNIKQIHSSGKGGE